MIKFNRSKVFLGNLCKRKYRYKNTDKSIRYKKSGQVCVECNFLRSKKYRKQHIVYTKKWYKENRRDQLKRLRFNYHRGAISIYTFLGNLCKRHHEYKGTGKSLRYRINGSCTKCLRI